MITFTEVCPCCNQIKIASSPPDFDWSPYVGSGNSSSCVCEVKTISDERHEELIKKSFDEFGHIWESLERASTEDLLRFEEELDEEKGNDPTST